MFSKGRIIFHVHCRKGCDNNVSLNNIACVIFAVSVVVIVLVVVVEEQLHEIKFLLFW